MDTPNPRQYITFVCTGNICRSPMAEALFIHAIKNDPELAQTIKVISVGTNAFPNQPASTNAIKALKECSITLNHHSSKSITQEIIDQSIAIFCMTEGHRNAILLNFDIDENGPPVCLLREFLTTSGSKDIPDPFGMDVEYYKECRDSIVEAIPSVIQYVKEKLLKNHEN